MPDDTRPISSIRKAAKKHRQDRLGRTFHPWGSKKCLRKNETKQNTRTGRTYDRILSNLFSGFRPYPLKNGSSSTQKTITTRQPLIIIHQTPTQRHPRQDTNEKLQAHLTSEVDYKIISKAITKKFQSHMSKLIQEGQQCSIVGRKKTLIFY